MKFTINRSKFIRELNLVSHAISSKTTIPILTGLKIIASDNGLTLTGSNSDISIETIIKVNKLNDQLNIERSGAIVLPARFFNDIVKRLPEENLTLTVTDGFQTEITSGNASFTINGLDAHGYPKLPDIDDAESITLTGSVFKDLINQTVIAVSTQESRPILTGVHFTLNGNKLTAVATDSHRLSQRQISLSKSAATLDDHDVIIPGKSLGGLSRMIGETNHDVEMRLSENQVLFTIGDRLFYSRLLEGKYPDTSRLIPTETTTSVEFDAFDLLSSIERASLLSHESRNNVVKLNLESNAKKATISSNSPGVGNVEEELNTSNFKGDSLDISFNPDYMKDALRTFGQASIKIAFISALQPFILFPTEDQTNFIQLITPVRTF